MLLDSIKPKGMYGFYHKKDKTYYLYLDDNVILAVPDKELQPTAEAAEYIQKNVDGESIKFFSRSVISELEACPPDEFDSVGEIFGNNITCSSWSRPENDTALLQITRYYHNNNSYTKRGLIIKLTEELLRNPPLSDVPEIVIKREIGPQFNIFGKV